MAYGIVSAGDRDGGVERTDLRPRERPMRAEKERRGERGAGSHELGGEPPHEHRRVRARNLALVVEVRVDHAEGRRRVVAAVQRRAAAAGRRRRRPPEERPRSGSQSRRKSALPQPLLPGVSGVSESQNVPPAVSSSAAPS